MVKKETFVLFIVILLPLFFSSYNSLQTEAFTENILTPEMYIFNEVATNFEVTDVDSGISYTLSSFLGKVVVLDLFATWCSPCAVALPYLRELHLKYQSKLFQIISIDTDNRETQAQVSQFRQDSEMDWIVSLDPDGVINNAYGTGSIPSFYIIDQAREIYWSEVGFSAEETWPVMKAKIEELMVEETVEDPTNSSPAGKGFLTALKVIASLGASVAAIYGLNKIRIKLTTKKCLNCRSTASSKCSKCGKFTCSKCSTIGCTNCGSKKFIRL